MNKRIFFIANLVIFLSFVLSIIVSNYNLSNYDKIVTSSNISYHQMIKTDALRYMGHGAEIKKQLDEGINFFSTGRENYTKYLPPRLAALYYYTLDINLFENFDEKIVKTGIHHKYLYIQCLIYFASVLFFYLTLRRKYDEKILFFIAFFLCLEPTIFQYHGTFWSESVFFSLQIFILAQLLKDNKKLILNDDLWISIYLNKVLKVDIISAFPFLKQPFLFKHKSIYKKHTQLGAIIETYSN